MSATICRPVVPVPVDIRAADIFGFCPDQPLDAIPVQLSSARSGSTVGAETDITDVTPTESRG